MAISEFRSWPLVRVDANLTFLPQTLDLSPPRSAAVILMLFGLFWIGIAIVSLRDVTTPQTGEFAILAAGALIGLSIIGWATTLLFRRHIAVLSDDGVEVTQRSLFGAKAWYEPYRAYKGVLRRKVVVRTKNSSRTYQVIELLHEDRDKCVPLFIRQTKEQPRSQWEGYAERLELPALEIEDGGLSARQHDELDKSLRERVADGAVSHAFDPDERPPAGLEVTRDHADSFTIAITAPRFPLWFFGIFVVIGLGLIGASLLGGDDSVMMFLAGLLFGGFPLYLLYRDRTTSRAIRLDRQRLTVEDPMRGKKRGTGSLAFDQIESITLRTEKGSIGSELVIAGDAGEIAIGSGLSREALDWLKNFLVAAIATA